MSASCYYQNYSGPIFKTNNTEKASKHVTKISRNINGTRAIKTSFDSIDEHLLSPLRHRATAPPPITDSEYNRLHDVLFDTDLEFRAALLERWRIRGERLAPWTVQEQNDLIRRWFSRASHWSPFERLLFQDMTAVAGISSKMSTDAASDVASAEQAAKSTGEDKAGEDKAGEDKAGEDKAGEDGKTDLKDQGEAGPGNEDTFRNSDGKYDSGCCPMLVEVWAARANRVRPFPRAVADKLLAAWLGPESAWTSRERVIFHAGHDPAAERADQVGAEEKRHLLDILVARNEYGAEPLLNGRDVAGHEPKPTVDDAADEVFATPLDAEFEPTASDYEKELKRFLAANTEADCRRFAKTVKAAVRRADSRVARLMKAECKMDATILRQALFPNSTFGFTFERCGP